MSLTTDRLVDRVSKVSLISRPKVDYMAVADSTTRPPAAAATPSGGKPILDGERGTLAHYSVYLFVVLPLLALLAAIPAAWGWELG